MRRRRAVVVLIVGTIVLTLLGGALPRLIEESFPLGTQSTRTGVETPSAQTPAEPNNTTPTTSATPATTGSALAALETLEVKGRAPKTGYARSEFGNGWGTVQGCNTRDIILYRDLTNPVLDGACDVVAGTLMDTYTAETITYTKADSSVVQIDHVVALSDAWQKGAQQLTKPERVQLANDPLELIAVSGAANQAKSDADAATWLPKNRAFRCYYIARQVSIKVKYRLWVTTAEKQAMSDILQTCPDEPTQ